MGQANATLTPARPARGGRKRGGGLLWVGALVLGLVGIMLLAASWTGSTGSADEIGRRMPDEGRQHVPVGTRVRYGHYPPTSGPHWPRPARWGVYDEAVPEEVWVHNLEHGGIVLLYHCPTPCPDLVRQLRLVYATFPSSKHGHVKLLITPYPKLRTRLAILAWTWLDELEELDRDRLLRFYKTHVDRGPEDVP